MSKLRLLVVGDLHWGSLKSLFINWLFHTTSMLDQIKEYAIAHGIKHIVFTGDIFNVAQPTQEELRTFAEYFKTFDVTCYFFLGNHDIQDVRVHSLDLFKCISEYALPNCQFIVEPKVITMSGHPVIINPWPHTKIPKNGESAKIGFAHVIASNTYSDNGRKFTNGEKLPKSVFWFIGDLHKYQRSNRWLYPGAPLQKSFQDDTQRYFFDVVVKDEVSIKRIKLQSTYKLLTKTIKKPNEFDFLKSPNTFWRIYADYDIHVPESQNILLRLPRTKNAKLISKDVTKGIDTVTIDAQLPTADSYLRNQGYAKLDRRRLLNKLESLR